MRKPIYDLLSFVFLLALLHSSCSKEPINPEETSANHLPELEQVSNFSNLIDTGSEADVSIDYDAIVLFSGTAIASVIQAPEFEHLLLEFYESSASRSVTELCNTFPEFRTQLNSEIRQALEMDIYADWKAATFGSTYLDDNDFDFVSLFDGLIKSHDRDEILSFYKPEILGNTSDDAAFYLGLDLPTLDKDKALVFRNGAKFLLSEELTQNLGASILFLGINKPETAQARFNYWVEVKLDKWWHHGKVTLQVPNHEIEAWWITKYRWYSEWKLKEIQALSSQGASTEYYYWGYRITSHVEHWTPNDPSFAIYHKHWPDDIWQLAYQHN